MEGKYTSAFTEEERAARRAQRAAARKKKQQERRRRQLLLMAPFFLLGGVFVVLLTALATNRTAGDDVPKQTVMAASMPSMEAASQTSEPEQPFSVSETAETVQLGEELPSAYAILVDLDEGTILAEKEARTVISPASMTKILTLLVAAEHVTDLDDTFTMTIDITDYCYVNGCSVVGLDVGETVTIRELLYGTILPSGADAALGLATYVAGSQETFVTLMNEKLEELGLSETAHFTNCVGLYDPEHVCTVYDMAMILKAAMDNELCRQVLDARTYETAPTEAHPDGQVLSNWFLRRIEDKDTGGLDVIAAKTGYVSQSGNCAASCAQAPDGSRYICVTGNAYSSWRAIYDHAELYKTYCGVSEEAASAGDTGSQTDTSST